MLLCSQHMQGSPSSQQSSNNDSANPLAEFVSVVCPQCGEENSIGRPKGWSCACGQKLDADAHNAEAMREYWQTALRPITARRARLFILSLANMRGDAENDLSGAERLVKRFSDFFPGPFPDDSYFAHCLMRPELHSPADLRKFALGELIACRNHLRFLWTADREERDWVLYFVRKMAAGITAHPTLTPGVLEKRIELAPPPRDAFQQALLYLHSRARMARRCRNPNCKILPYFFIEKPNQKYCSDTCFDLVRDEVNRQWWREHGADWRENRKKAVERKGAKHAKR